MRPILAEERRLQVVPLLMELGLGMIYLLLSSGLLRWLEYLARRRRRLERFRASSPLLCDLPCCLLTWLPFR